MSEPLDGMDAMVLDLGSCADLKPAGKREAAVTAEGSRRGPPPLTPHPRARPRESCESLNASSAFSPRDLRCTPPRRPRAGYGGQPSWCHTWFKPAELRARCKTKIIPPPKNDSSWRAQAWQVCTAPSPNPTRAVFSFRAEILFPLPRVNSWELRHLEQRLRRQQRSV